LIFQLSFLFQADCFLRASVHAHAAVNTRLGIDGSLALGHADGLTWTL
jgi:hypothetical protein